MLYLLKNRNFCLLFIGRIVTNVGDSLYYVATMWLVHELGKDPFLTGLAGFLILLPKALQFLVGPLVDKWKIKKTLVFTQSLQAILLLFIPFAHATGILSVWMLLTFMPLVACIEEFAYPTQTKALPLVLQKSELVKGNALFSFAYQGIDLVSNSVAGLLIAFFGAITIFWIDSITFTLAALCFTFLKLPEQIVEINTFNNTSDKPVGRYRRDLIEGFRVVFRSYLWVFTVGAIVANFTIGMVVAILPTFSEKIGGVQTYGILLSAISAGSLIGALLAPILGRYHIGTLSITCFFFGGISWISAAIFPSLLFTACLFGLAWVPIGAVNVLFAGLIQSIVPNDILGRVNSVSYSLSISAMPIGSLVGGYLGKYIDSTLLFSICGLGIIFIALVWSIHPALRTLPPASQINAQTLNIVATKLKSDSGREHI
ncbi:MAG: MFS transporter [Exiguobacterium mexicanum]